MGLKGLREDKIKLNNQKSWRRQGEKRAKGLSSGVRYVQVHTFAPKVSVSAYMCIIIVRYPRHSPQKSSVFSMYPVQHIDVNLQFRDPNVQNAWGTEEPWAWVGWCVPTMAVKKPMPSHESKVAFRSFAALSGKTGYAPPFRFEFFGGLYPPSGLGSRPVAQELKI